MKVVIVEDELHSARMLKGMIKQIRKDWEVLETIESVKQGVSWFETNPSPDIIFMDIQLTDGISFSILEKVKIQTPIIFTTAYDDYAIQAFKANSIDYLLKPMKEENLRAAIEKYEKILKMAAQYTTEEKSELAIYKQDYSDILDALNSGNKVYRKRFLITGSKDFFKIETKDIAYFYTINRVTFAVSFGNREHAIDFTLEKLEEQLDPTQFFRANRSQIINLDAIGRFEAFFGGKLNLKLIPPFKETITISRLKATEFKNWIDR